MSLLDTPQPNRLPQIIGVLIMAASIAVILFSGVSVITTDSVRTRLDQFAAHVYEHASKDGREGVFSYGDVEIQGWGFSKFAVVRNVSVEMAEKSLLDTTRWTFSTQRMDIQPDPVSLHNLIFVFPQPVNVIKNGQLKATVNFSEPLRYHFFDGPENNTHTIKHRLFMPAQLTLVPGRAVDSTQPVGEKLIISYDANPLVQFKAHPEKHEREVAYGFSHIRALSEDGSEITIASIASNFSEKPGPEGRPHGSYMLQVSDVVMQKGGKASTPYSMGLDFTYRGDQPALALRDLTPSAGNAEVTLNQLFLASNDFRIKAAGTFVLSVDDPLPFGAIQIDIENVQKFLASDLLPEPARQAIASALQKATSQPVATLTNVSLPMKREMKGVMHVGNITFEELVASLVADLMKPPARPTVLPPPIPSDTAPASGTTPPAMEIK